MTNSPSSASSARSASACCRCSARRWPCELLRHVRRCAACPTGVHCDLPNTLSSSPCPCIRTVICDVSLLSRRKLDMNCRCRCKDLSLGVHNPLFSLYLSSAHVRVRGLNNFRGHFFRPGHTCFGLRDRGGQRAVSAPGSASGAPPQASEANWGANRGYFSFIFTAKNAASKGEVSVKTWRRNYL